MDSAGGFQFVDNQLVYYHPKYNPLPTSSDETTSYDQPLQLLFVCLVVRLENKSNVEYDDFVLINVSPEDIPSTTMNGDDHLLLPLHWCENDRFFDYAWCCVVATSGNYYFCKSCDETYHKECVESPIQIEHPYHIEHSLQLSCQFSYKECFCCGKKGAGMGYYCTSCKVYIHPTCAMKPIPFVIDQPKRHGHSLTFFPRQSSLICNICGLLRETSGTYVCLKCNFVAHHDCMNFPHIIKISRHGHRISYTSTLRSENLFCGVCRESINADYGSYTCGKCDDYAVHSRCALRNDVWDGEELEDVPEEEEDDLTQDAEPFEIISNGVIHHFLHEHDLRLEVVIFYDEHKICEACYLPVYEGNFYSCIECDFIIHEACARAPRRIQHALHPHPLTLNVTCSDISDSLCNACHRSSCAFVYECEKEHCIFELDFRCASISEPFDYKGHKHPLFLALDPVEKPICEVCKMVCRKEWKYVECLNCIECDFIVCMKCATLPYKARYQHDTHFLTIKFGKEVCKEDWCEACERKLGDTDSKVFYWCDVCCTTLHVDCLLGEKPYFNPGRILK